MQERERLEGELKALEELKKGRECLTLILERELKALDQVLILEAELKARTEKVEKKEKEKR